MIAVGINTLVVCAILLLLRVSVAGAQTTFDFQMFNETLKGNVFLYGTVAYSNHSSAWNELSTPTAKAVVVPEAEDDVVKSIRFAKRFNLPVLAKSGGHDYGAYCIPIGGLAVSFDKFKNVVYNPTTGVVTGQAGVLYSQVYDLLLPNNRISVAGMCPEVGIGGYLQGGGFGIAASHYGWGVDTVLSYRVVLASGEIVTADASGAYHDLFWALQGGSGGNFGVVTEFTFSSFPLNNMALFGDVVWGSTSDFILVLSNFAKVRQTLDSRIFILVEGVNTFQLYWTGSDTVEGQRIVSQVIDNLSAGVATPPTSSVKVQSLLDAVQSEPPFNGYDLYPRSGFINASSLTPTNMKIIAEQTQPLLVNSSTLMFEFMSVHGQMNAPSPTDTAFYWRDAHAMISWYYLVPHGTKPNPADFSAWEKAWSMIKPITQGQYVNYRDVTLTKDEWPQRYFGGNVDRLVSIKQKYDPSSLFSFPQGFSELVSSVSVL